MPSESSTASVVGAESACQTGLEFLSRGDLTAACKAFEAAIALAPSMAQAHLGLGNSLRRQRKPHEAESALRCACTLDPALRDAAYSLAYLLHSAGRDAETAAALKNLAAREPADLTLHRQVAGLLMEFGCFEDAEPLARKIAEVAPAAGAWQRLGLCLLQLKRLTEAEAAFTQAVHHDPLAGSAYLLMSQTRCATEADRIRLGELQVIVESGKIIGEARACLHFALGNWLEDLGDYAAAWGQFSAGNELRRSERPFDRAVWQDYFLRLMNTGVDRDRNPSARQTIQPLFLVGLPGTNAEPLASMLAVHPAICSLGTSGQVDGLARACEQLADAAYPGCLAKVEAAQLEGLGQGFRSDWPEKSPNSTWVLDESQLNFLHLALIVRVFPGSRIIYQHRHPMDDCLSAYLNPFIQPMHNHAHDLQNLGFFYRQFSALMHHWQASLPIETLLTVQTSPMLVGSTAEIAAIWKFLDLDAPPPGELQNLVSRTVPVTDPMRRDIPGRWRNYREHLVTLIEAVGPESE